MNKIEKLKNHMIFSGYCAAGEYPPDNKEMMSKINEIIDALNELSEQLKEKKDE